MKKIAIILALLWAPSPVLAQSALLQGGPWTPGHAPVYVPSGQSQAVVVDSGPARGGPPGTGLSELLVTAQGTGTPPYSNQGSGPYGSIGCLYDAPVTNPTGYHFFCLSPNTTDGFSTGGLLSYGAGGMATPLPLNILVNNVPTSFYQNGFIQSPTITVNFAVAGDNAIVAALPPGYTQLRAYGFVISQCSGTLSGATFGAFTSTGGTGGALLTAGATSAITNNTPNTANNFQYITATNVNSEAYTPTNGTVYFRVGSTVPASCRVFLLYNPVP